MTEPRKRPWASKTPDVEEDIKRREAEKAARESEQDLVRRAVEKRFIRKDPPRRKG